MLPDRPKHQIAPKIRLAPARSGNRDGFIHLRLSFGLVRHRTGQQFRSMETVLGETAGAMLGRDLESLFQRAKDYKKEYGDS
ncbi:hypothetical protein ACOSP7_019316 [Xanthoceras sorbifolium]